MLIFNSGASKSGLAPALVASLALIGNYLLESNITLLIWLLCIIILQILLFWTLGNTEEKPSREL